MGLTDIVNNRNIIATRYHVKFNFIKINTYAQVRVPLKRVKHEPRPQGFGSHSSIGLSQLVPVQPGSQTQLYPFPSF